MSDLGVLVPILAPSGFGTRQSAASNTAESGERAAVSGLSSASTASVDRSAAAPGAAPVDPLTGLALSGLTAGLIATLQEAEDRPGEAGGDAARSTAGEGEADTETADGEGEDGEDGVEGAAGGPAARSGNAGPSQLTPEQQQVVRELERTDAEIRRHEQAHAAAGGPYAGAPSYDYARGPDGRLYAVGGDVQIDVAAVPGNPEATIQKMQTVRRAALAPASPSPQDQRVAAIAQQRINEARQERSELELEERQAAAEKREEAQQRAEGLQPGDSGVTGAAQSSGDAAAATIPSLVLGSTTVSGPVTTNGELLNVIA